MAVIPDESVALVVTSPPYPMIAMWDAHFQSLAPGVSEALAAGDGSSAFDAMHRLLDPVWAELWRVLSPGGFVCVNVGDAVRTVGGRFSLYPNHIRILWALQQIGFSPLPVILWRKPTNSPTKFMGSGMLPAGAYVTLEHETIIVARKGGKRRFASPEERALRRESAFFWEERNRWFSDVWTELRGAGQRLKNTGRRDRSAAFPLELPYRLISMFSVKKDRVLDPFLGTGSTMLAAMAAGRSSIGFETDAALAGTIEQGVQTLPEAAVARIEKRLADHRLFVDASTQAGRRMKYQNRHYGFAVMTSQETDLFFNPVCSVEAEGENGYRVFYGDT
jgi:DNA modification methylase